MEPQVKLQWNRHQGSIISVFDTLLTNESLVDVTLACEGQYIRAHKVILSACSPYFQELFNIDPIKHPIFFLKDVKFIQLKALIHYMYHGEITISQKDVQSFMEIAHALKIRGLAGAVVIHNISSATPPDHGIKKVTMPTISPLPPVPLMTPSPAVIPKPIVLESSNVHMPRIHKVQSLNTSASHSLISSTATNTTFVPQVKKRRIEIRLPTRPTTTVPKQSQLVDPLLEVDSPNTMSSLVYPLESFLVPNSSTPYAASCHSQRQFQDKDNEYQQMYQHMEPFQTEIKPEPNGSIDVNLVEGENSMSQSSFTESWRPGDDGDNSQLHDDHEKLPPEFGTNGSSVGGKVYRCPLPSCKRTYSTKKSLHNHRYYCSRPKSYICICGSQFKVKSHLMRHHFSCPSYPHTGARFE